MKAVVLEGPQKSLKIEERKRPKPGPGEVLLRVHACGVCHGDLMVQQGAFPFVSYPIVLGHEVAGVVEETGKGVDKLKPGDRVGLSARPLLDLWLMPTVHRRRRESVSAVVLDRRNERWWISRIYASAGGLPGAAARIT